MIRRGGAEVASGFFGIGRRAECGNDGNPVGAGFADLSRVARMDTADGDENLLSLAAQHGESIESPGGTCVWFCRRGEDGANAEVVDGKVRRLQGLLGCFHRQADDCAGTEEPADVTAVHVGLANVYAIGGDGQRHVGAIVNDERHVSGGEDSLQASGHLDEIPRGALLFAKLNECDATAHRRGNYLFERAAGGEPAIGDQAETPVG